MTAMVSPMARPIPRIIAAVIPDIAEGTTILLMVCHRVAPTARDPSLYSRGTELIASSATLVMVGIAMIPRSIDPASHDSPVGTSKVICNHVVRTINPKKPNTTDGIPASSSIAGFIIAFIRGVASSAIKMALPILRGIAMSIAPRVTSKVSTIKGNAP